MNKLNYEKDIALSIEKLLVFAKHKNLLDPRDEIYARNSLMDLLNVSEPLQADLPIDLGEIPSTVTPIMKEILDYAVKTNLINKDSNTLRDLFDTRVMGMVTPPPSFVEDKFALLKSNNGIDAATEWFYDFCKSCDYIRVDKIANNIIWKHQTSDFGILEITINLTKPEKDPKEVAAQKLLPQTNYPKCVLCRENVGYPGRMNHNARQTLRQIPLTLANEDWSFQYSPYVYYNEHCIVLKNQHDPMKINKKSFERLFDFVELFPKYFIGSNADLPIVGGSILNHDHFQGGKYVFPMHTSPIEIMLHDEKNPQIDINITKWPMSVISLKSSDRVAVLNKADEIFKKWQNYSDKTVNIMAFSGGVPHNTVTPIARMLDDNIYHLDLVLRNNRISDEHPIGIFHPHANLHNIKRENIGLIEVMGLFILPGRLKVELDKIKSILIGRQTIKSLDLIKADIALNNHMDWITMLINKYGSDNSKTDADNIIDEEVGRVCLQVLKDAGVYKTDKDGRNAFIRFVNTCGLTVVL